jgi:TIR domain
MHKIFISYRHEDSIETTGRIYDWLDSRLAPNNIFMDVDSIPPGADFRVAIKDTVTSAGVMLAVIGPRWLTVREPNGGAPRIDNPNDFVRIEVELAIQNNIPIIPVLVQEATMPAADDLPTSLVSLAYRTAVKVRPNPDFQGDMIRVMKGIESIDSGIVFLQQEGKANEHVEKEPTNPEPDLPPIPEGGRPEYGFYYIKVVERDINVEKEDRFIKKEFARSDSPANKHIARAHFFQPPKWAWERKCIELVVWVDDVSITVCYLRLDYGQVDEEITTYGPDYDKSTTLNGHTYNVKYNIKGTYTLKEKKSIANLGEPAHSWSYQVSRFEVSVDGYTLFDQESLWD